LSSVYDKIIPFVEYLSERSTNSTMHAIKDNMRNRADIAHRRIPKGGMMRFLKAISFII
jgi:hypothetical protein